MRNHRVAIKKQIEVALVIPDLHVPYQNKGVVNIAKQLAKDLLPDHLIYIGDCFDAEQLGRWTKKTIEEGIYRTRWEIKKFKDEVYDPLRIACPQATVYWTGGNHDMQRIKDVLIEMPERKELLDLEAMFPDCKMTEYNQFVKIGKLYFTHGEYHGSNHAKKHVTEWSENVMYGHTHTVQTYLASTKGENKRRKATSIGAACDLNPAYMKNKAHAWIHALTVVYFQKNGNYNSYVIEIMNNRCVFNNKLYKG